MLRASWKSLLARKLRLLMSAFAIVLDVAFVAGSLIFTDTLGRAFTNILAESVGDVVVRPVGAVGDGNNLSAKTLPASLVTDLAKTAGAARADGNVTALGVFVIDKSGKLIGGQGAPGIAVGYRSGPAAHGLNGLSISSGRAPAKAGEITLDALSGSPLIFEPRTAVAAYLVGMLVTAFAAYLPGRRASRISPVEAMRDDVAMPERSIRRRTLVDAAMTALGAAAMSVGLFTEIANSIAYIGGGILLVVLGVALASPLLGRPVLAIVGVFYRRMFGTVGHLAEQNALRNPRRTAATASALMIGLTLVSMMAVFGQSAKASIDKTLGASISADYVVSNAVGVPFSPTIADQVAAVPGVGAVARFRYTMAKVAGESTQVGGIEPAAFAKAMDVTLDSGKIGDLRGKTLLVERHQAKDLELKVGDSVKMSIAGTEASYPVVGIFEGLPNIWSAYLTSLDAVSAAGLVPADNLAYVVRSPGADAAQVRAGIDALIADLPTITLKDQAEFAAEQRAPIDQMRMLIYALLGLAVVIAILGIINTLALSVIERTREVGLLRAVGLSRRQLRTMVRLESMVISLLGAVLGVGLGLVFGIALQRSQADAGIGVLSIPGGQLVIFVVLAALVGVLAAVWPARRAARLDVLRAVTTD